MRTKIEKTPSTNKIREEAPKIEKKLSALEKRG